MTFRNRTRLVGAVGAVALTGGVLGVVAPAQAATGTLAYTCPVSGQPNPPLRYLTLTSGEKQVAINLDNMNPGGPHTYEVSIDHKGARSG